MNCVVRKSDLSEIFDQITREITQREGGIQLIPHDEGPEGDIYTVYAVFERGFRTCLSLCAEERLFRRLTQHMMQTEDVTPRDVEDFTKEYFNVLCGHIVTRLFQKTHIPARFQTPVFQKGPYRPANRLKHIVLTYTGDQNERAQLIHHTPEEGAPGPLCPNDEKEETAL